MQCACAILSSIACPAVQYFSILSNKRHDSREKLLNMKCAFWFSLQCLSESVLILRRIERDIIKMYVGLHVKYPSFLSGFNQTGILTTNFRKISNIKFHENPSSGSGARWHTTNYKNDACSRRYLPKIKRNINTGWVDHNLLTYLLHGAESFLRS